jgi:threonylcarbamoyladenosine tRNA methylthiotransferase MtaB
MKVYLQTFGCRANQYDSEAVAAMVLAGGGEMVASAALADVAVFNSCAVTHAAEADLRQQVRRAARQRPTLRSVVMGCASARSADTIAHLPSVSDVIGGADLAAVGAALGLPAPAVTAGTLAQRGTRGLLRIQDGCDEHCTFCATTLARGANRSRSIEELALEAEQLGHHHAEIVVTGVHIGTYGADIGTSLGVLLETLVARVPQVRFRLSSVEATEVDARLANLLTGVPRQVAPYLHAPLQSGSDAVLRRMGRHWYTARAYADAISHVLARTSVFGLGADVIVGFPGESTADFYATRDLIRDLPFTGLHVFTYSPRPGTAALKLGAAVAPPLARERAAELRALAEQKQQAYTAQRSGGQADVIVIGHDDGAREGMTEDYLTVALADPMPARGTRYQARLVPSPPLPRLRAVPFS